MRRGYSCVIVPTLDKQDKVRGNQELLPHNGACINRNSLSDQGIDNAI